MGERCCFRGGGSRSEVRQQEVRFTSAHVDRGVRVELHGVRNDILERLDLDRVACDHLHNKTANDDVRKIECAGKLESGSSIRH